MTAVIQNIERCSDSHIPEGMVKGELSTATQIQAIGCTSRREPSMSFYFVSLARGDENPDLTPFFAPTAVTLDKPRLII
jgi:hypothetical protein